MADEGLVGSERHAGSLRGRSVEVRFAVHGRVVAAVGANACAWLRAKEAKSCGGRPVSDSTVAVTCSAIPCRACAKMATDLLGDELGQAGLDHPQPRILSGKVDELDLAGGGGRECRRDLGIGDCLRAGEYVGLPLVAGCREHGRRSGADVAGVDHRDPRLARGGVEAALEGHLLGGGEQVRHEEARPQHHGRHSAISAGAARSGRASPRMRPALQAPPRGTRA